MQFVNYVASSYKSHMRASGGRPTVHGCDGLLWSRAFLGNLSNDLSNEPKFGLLSDWNAQHIDSVSYKRWKQDNWLSVSTINHYRGHGNFLKQCFALSSQMWRANGRKQQDLYSDCKLVRNVLQTNKNYTEYEIKNRITNDIIKPNAQSWLFVFSSKGFYFLN